MLGLGLMYPTHLSGELVICCVLTSVFGSAKLRNISSTFFLVILVESQWRVTLVMSSSSVCTFIKVPWVDPNCLLSS